MVILMHAQIMVVAETNKTNKHIDDWKKGEKSIELQVWKGKRKVSWKKKTSTERTMKETKKGMRKGKEREKERKKDRERDQIKVVKAEERLLGEIESR